MHQAFVETFGLFGLYPQFIVVDIGLVTLSFLVHKAPRDAGFRCSITRLE